MQRLLLLCTYGATASTDAWCARHIALQMAGPARMDTLANAFFSERPRAVVYVNVESDTAPGQVTKHYFSFGTHRASHPKLFLLYPTATAPAGAPHLCVLLGPQYALQTLLDSLPDYTAAQPGAADTIAHLDCGRGDLLRFLTSHRKHGSTQLPHSCSDDSLLKLFHDKYKIPELFKVRRS